MKKLRIPSAKAAVQPATRGMLALVRDELKTDIFSIRSKLESHDHRFDSIDHRFESLERRFDSVDAKFGSIDSRFESIDARFEAIDARFEAIDRQFESVKARFNSVDVRFNNLRSEMRAGFDEIRAELVRMATLVEEQNANNRIVLEGHQLLWQRQERLESEPRNTKT